MVNICSGSIYFLAIRVSKISLLTTIYISKIILTCIITNFIFRIALLKIYPYKSFVYNDIKLILSHN